MASIQSKLGEGLAKFQEGIDQGKQKIKTTQEVSKLKKQVQDASQRKSEILLNLGQVTYQFIREGKISEQELIEMSKPLVGFDHIIFEANKKIAELTTDGKAEYTCECGAPITASDKFCGSCGKKVEIKQPENHEHTVCSSCGVEVDKEAAFCGCCGSKLA